MFLLCVLCYLLFVILLFLLLIELYSILVTGHCVLLHLLVCTVFTLFVLFPILLNFLQFTIFTMLFNTVHLRFTVFFYCSLLYSVYSFVYLIRDILSHTELPLNTVFIIFNSCCFLNII